MVAVKIIQKLGHKRIVILYDKAAYATTYAKKLADEAMDLPKKERLILSFMVHLPLEKGITQKSWAR